MHNWADTYVVDDNDILFTEPVIVTPDIAVASGTTIALSVELGDFTKYAQAAAVVATNKRYTPLLSSVNVLLVPQPKISVLYTDLLIKSDKSVYWCIYYN